MPTHINYSEFINSDRSFLVPGLQRKVTIRTFVIATLTAVFCTTAIACSIALMVAHGETRTITTRVNITEVCTTPDCFSSSASIVAFRNNDTNPCDNFHQYACGGWNKIFPKSSLHSDERERTIFHKLEEDAEKNIEKVLLQPAASDALLYEKKIKQFYATCIDDFTISSQGGKPFIDQIISDAFGWNALPGWNEETYDLTAAMKKVHSSFWQPSLFNIQISTDWENRSKNVIEIGLGGLTLRWWDYVGTTSKHQKLFEDTKKFMRDVSKLLIRDSGEVGDEAEISRLSNEFAEDVFNFEQQLANTTWYTLPSDDPHAHENRVTVRKMNDLADEFNWVEIITEMFDTARVNENTKIVLLEKEFLGKLNQLIKNLPEKKKTLNNYFTWRLMLGFVTDLGWEYVHANREFWVARTGLAEFTGIPKYCFNKVKYHFSEGLGALYIRDHLLTNDKATIDNLVAYLKRGLQDRLNKLTWMEEKSRRIAIEKVKQMVDKAGYPSWMTDNDFIDQQYHEVKIEEDQYLQNLIEIASFEKEKANQLLIKGEDTSRWRLNVWEAGGGYDQWWNEILITAGLLQWPIYARNFPKYYNFGALGITIGHELMHAVDEIGGYYLPNGTYFDWWTTNTTTNYNKRRACLENLDLKAGPYQATPDSEIRIIRIDGTYAARELTAEMAAIRIAYNAYKDWVADNSEEKRAPGVGLTNEQTMFLAYAQTQCFVRRDDYSISRAERQIIPEDIRLNAALAHTPEFVKAFSCDATTNMHATDKCEVF